MLRTPLDPPLVPRAQEMKVDDFDLKARPTLIKDQSASANLHTAVVVSNPLEQRSAWLEQL